MKKSAAFLLIALFAIQYLYPKTNFSNLSNTTFNFGIETQGGILEFSSSNVIRVENSVNNCDSIVLKDYSGQPLKALQLKIIVGSKGGKLKLNSLSRGSSIPASSFIFDYQIYKGAINADGSSIDEVRVVILGNDENVLLPKQVQHILSINYNIVQLENDSILTNIKIIEVIGATCSPVQDANITVGNEKNIFLQKQSIIPESEVILQQNYPNPFNPNTSIRYAVNSKQFVTIKIYDILGNEIETLVNEDKTAGVYEVNWNAAGTPSGVYFYQVNSGSYSEIKKMILLK